MAQGGEGESISTQKLGETISSGDETQNMGERRQSSR